jgi:hypothetical protein
LGFCRGSHSYLVYQVCPPTGWFWTLPRLLGWAYRVKRFRK